MTIMYTDTDHPSLDIERSVIEGAGHYSFLDNPVLFNRILGSFLHIG